MTVAEKPIVLNEALAIWIPEYINAFSKAYWKYGTAHGATPSQLLGYLRVYHASIRGEIQAICDDAEAGISAYLNQYNIGTEDTVDEYKLIYFIGLAILKHLPEFKVLKGVHLFVMVGFLDFKLQEINIIKPQLVTAITQVIRAGLFEAELGATGCYLIYKCISTTPTHMVKAQQKASKAEPKVKGTGLDAPSPSITERVVKGL